MDACCLPCICINCFCIPPASSCASLRHDSFRVILVPFRTVLFRFVSLVHYGVSFFHVPFRTVLFRFVGLYCLCCSVSHDVAFRFLLPQCVVYIGSALSCHISLIHGVCVILFRFAYLWCFAFRASSYIFTVCPSSLRFNPFRFVLSRFVMLRSELFRRLTSCYSLSYCFTDPCLFSPPLVAEQEQFDLLERCSRRFKDDERYKNDQRYLKVWIAYVSDYWLLFSRTFWHTVSNISMIFICTDVLNLS